ncbi:putative serine/threonine-protein kinase receptor [Cotonvirus japonicus]|uniref:Serine/threonine-protein kinase receptor n=1 Tax=Cotonvirus japonicus TaxID=2811091 RepID=A0ABM7NQY8_9VIRU|nr:putative serine/threonine-protein kinase receptor [Cotonvirus japonicus]BCS82572.1 putative serine/threonine-protein kinase receptor [Cotonvirus japonicus]
MSSVKIFMIFIVMNCAILCTCQMGSRIYCSGSLSSVILFEEYVKGFAHYNDDVTIVYAGMSVDEINADVYIADCSGYDRAIPKNMMIEYGLIQFPIVGQAIVIIYNIPGFPSGHLVVDRETLGKIWTGSIRMWNDIEIKNLNPEMASLLPNETITLGYNDAYYLSVSEIMQLTLRNFSTEFAEAHTLAGNKFAGMVPALEGYAIDAGESSESRINWVKNTSYSLSFADFATVYQHNVSYMFMYNKAGNLVEPNITSVQSAMADFKDIYTSNDFTIDIFDAPGNYSWPISWVNYISMNGNFQQTDCFRTKDLLNFIAWLYTNNEIAENIKNYQYYPLDNTIKKIAIDNMYDVKCNNKISLERQYLIGFGSPLSIMASWPDNWATSVTTMKYYTSLSEQSFELQKTYSGDFGIVIKDLSDSYYSQIEDIGIAHLAAFNIVPAYNIPELIGVNETIVLDYETIVDIYTGVVTNWNHTNIRRLNTPYINSLLPNKTITVVVQNVESDINELFTSFLSDNSERFKNLVGSTKSPKFILNDNNVAYTDDINGVGNVLISIDYSFAFWSDPGIRALTHMSIVRPINIQTDTGKIISPSDETLANAVNDKANNLNQRDSDSWPLIAMISLIYRQKTMRSFSKASAVADFIYWTQSSEMAHDIADIQGYYIASNHPKYYKENLELLKSFTFEGKNVSEIANCINDGSICSNSGSCTDGVCICQKDRIGDYCESVVSESSDNSLTIILAVVIPVLFLIVIFVVAILIIIIIILRFTKKTDDNWEIDYSELDVTEQIGAGGNGTVHKAIWKGTEVAVKIMINQNSTKEIDNSFKDEVRIMKNLRHPNVVLFMAASTRPPRMCIVMEFMALGSLFEILGNELIPEIPFALKNKIAYQASKGMHFLHSSGIVHRDLKSLNLLLDSKWNVKVSDFGLTKFKSNINKNKSDKQMNCSIHWTAPEILNDSSNIDYILSDVYSFGIILWELLTREQPYHGMSVAAIAVSVIRDNARPPISEGHYVSTNPDYIDLIKNCWHYDPAMRPTFLEIMTKLTTMTDDSSMFNTTTSSSGYSSNNSVRKMKQNFNTGNSENISSSASFTSNKEINVIKTNISHPTGNVTIVITDIISATQLWNFDATAMKEATLIYNKTIRDLVTKYQGYESIISRETNTGEGSFCVVFSNADNAIEFAHEVQLSMLEAPWPAKLLEHSCAREEFDHNDRIIYRGLRVRIGINHGPVKANQDNTTHKYYYSGPTVNTVNNITVTTHGGQILISRSVKQIISDTYAVTKLSGTDIMDGDGFIDIYDLKIPGLEGRFFGGAYMENEIDHDNSFADKSDGVIIHSNLNKEDCYLTSANLCSWIVNYNDIAVDTNNQLGIGSYGIVYKGKWKGVDVAVKKFIKQSISEKEMLNFREEVSILSRLSEQKHHPNIILMIGACITKPNICIITEYMKRGNLRQVLKTQNIKISWIQKLKMLKGIAEGINYLHTSDPIIIHRDIKPSNILVDDNYVVKISDFGFATIKQENTRMTRCGTPCWTAPEILRGEKYDEKVDVYSFGVVMWEMMTAREPYAGCNFMKVTLSIMEGIRPQIPADCPSEFKKLMKKCWSSDPEKRPEMQSVIEKLSNMIGDDDSIV